MIPLQVLSALLFPYSSCDSFSTYSMMSLTQVCVPLGDWSLQSLSGLAFLMTWACELNLASSVSRVKSPPTFILSFQLFLFPPGDFLTFHIDIVGPLPSSQGFNYLLTLIDHTTWWPKVATLSSISAES